MNTKATIFAAALSLASVSSYAQGTIQFVNTGTSLVSTNVQGVSGTANKTSTSGIVVALFYQEDNGGSAPSAITSITSGLGSWVQVGSTVVLNPSAGRFSSTLTTGSDVYGANNPSGNVWLQALAWDQNAGTYQAAATTSTLFGASTVWSQATGNPNGVPATAAVSTTPFTGIVLTPVPEPTTIALAGLGAASLLLFRRRK